MRFYAFLPIARHSVSEKFFFGNTKELKMEKKSKFNAERK